MSLKIATERDIDALKRMALLFHQNSPYRDIAADEEKVEAVCREMVNKAPNEGITLLAMGADEPVGMLAAHAQEMVMGRTRVASELVWWVDPEYRNSRISLRLIEAYEYWAKNVAKCELVQMALLHDYSRERIDSFYRRRGYRPTEHIYLKDI